MQVIFATKSKNQNRYSINNIPGFGRMIFDKGVKITTDKGLIKALLNHKLYERGDFYLVSNEEMVANYLDGKLKDKLTKELLDGLSIQGLKELGRHTKCKSEQPSLIKVEALGKPITNKVQEILDTYTVKESFREKPKEPEEFIVKRSGDMTAQEAVEYITITDASNLEGFLNEDEERKTVLSAWNKKFPKEG